MFVTLINITQIFDSDSARSSFSTGQSKSLESLDSILKQTIKCDKRPDDISDGSDDKILTEFWNNDSKDHEDNGIGQNAGNTNFHRLARKCPL